MRSPVRQTLSANGDTPILNLDYIQMAFGVGIGVYFSEDAATITWSILTTFDDFGPDNFQPVSLSQTTTVITVTDAGLPARGGVVVGDVVIIQGSGQANVDGQYAVATAPTPTTYTLTSAVSQSFTGGPFTKASVFHMFAAPTALTAQTAKGTGSLAHSTTGPVTGALMRMTGRTAGSASVLWVQGAGPSGG
jgi:hypothetical protein